MPPCCCSFKVYHCGRTWLVHGGFHLMIKLVQTCSQERMLRLIRPGYTTSVISERGVLTGVTTAEKCAYR